MTLKRAIKTTYAGIGLSAMTLLAIKEPALLGILVAGTVSFLLLIVFGLWVTED